MRWRDAQFGATTNLAVAGPLRPKKLAALDDAFRGWARSPQAASFRFRWVGGTGISTWQRVPFAELDDAIAAATVHLEDGLSLEQFTQRVRGLEYRDLGVMLLVSEPYAAVGLSHALSDGVVALQVVQAVLSGSGAGAGAGAGSGAGPGSGAASAHSEIERVTRFPVLRGLAHTHQLSPRALLAARRQLHADHRYLAMAPRLPTHGRHFSLARLGPRIHSFTISTERIAALAEAERKRSSDPTGRRPPPTAVLSTLLFRALRRCIADDVDLPIRMPVGLRRHLGAGWSTHGNFALVPFVGSLREREWSADDFANIVAPRIGSDDTMAEFAYENLVDLGRRLRARVGRSTRYQTSGTAANPGDIPGANAAATAGANASANTAANAAANAAANSADIPPAGPFWVSLNILPGGVGLRSDDYIAGEEQHAALTMVTRDGYVGPHVAIAATGRAFIVTAVDDTGLVDVLALEAAVRAEEVARI